MTDPVPSLHEQAINAASDAAFTYELFVPKRTIETAVKAYLNSLASRGWELTNDSEDDETEWQPISDIRTLIPGDQIYRHQGQCLVYAVIEQPAPPGSWGDLRVTQRIGGITSETSIGIEEGVGWEFWRSPLYGKPDPEDDE